MDKKELRKEYLKIRHDIKNKTQKSSDVFNKIINLDIYKDSKTIGIYYSIDDEVSTISLVDYSLELGKEVCLPRVIDNNEMEFHKITDRFNLSKSKYGVLEPTNNNLVNPKSIDLLIIPGVVFSKELYRIGYGAGYYDRYLVKTNAYKIGLSFKETIIDVVPHDENDVKLDIIITD